MDHVRNVQRENLLHIIRVDSINKYIFIEYNIGKPVMLARRVFLMIKK